MLLNLSGPHGPTPSISTSCEYRPKVSVARWSELFAFVAMLCVVCGGFQTLEAQASDGQISVTIPDALVDSHPYGIVTRPGSSLGYCAIAGDVTPFGEATEDYANFVIAELDLHSLTVQRTFQVGYFPTEMVILNEQLFATCSNDSNLYRIDLDPGTVTAFPMTDSVGGNVTFLSGLTIAPGGKVVVGSNGGNFDGSDENVLIFDPVTESIVDRFVVAGAITRLMVEGNELVIPVGYPDNDFTAAPAVYWVDLSTGLQTGSVNLAVDTADFPSPSDIQRLQDGTALVSVFGGSDEVFQINLSQKSLAGTFAVGGTDFSQSALQLLENGEVLVSDLLGGWIRSLNPQTGEVSDFGTGLSLPADMTLKSGRVFVTEQGLEQVAVYMAPGSFVRGDSNMDKVIDVGDPITLLEHLFLLGDLDCQDAADANDDGNLDIADAVSVLNYLFADGLAPAFPFPVGGVDLQQDTLDCLQGA